MPAKSTGISGNLTIDRCCDVVVEISIITHSDFPRAPRVRPFFIAQTDKRYLVGKCGNRQSSIVNNQFPKGVIIMAKLILERIGSPIESFMDPEN